MRESNTTVSVDKKNTGLMLLSNYRSFIMGVAILWVAWFHTDLPVSIPGLSFLREVGYGGVDLFFLMSGIGAWFSLKKNPDTVSYIKNRAKRMLPSYYPFIIAWLIMMKITGELYGTEIIGNLTMMGWWCDGRNQFNWYTNAIWLFYLLAPLFVGMLARAEDAKKKLLITFVLMAAGFVASMTFWHTLLLTAFSRLPLFVLGIYLGSEMLGQDVDKKHSFVWQKYPLAFWNVCMIVGFVLLYVCLSKLSGYMWLYGLWWYPFLFIAPGFAVDLGLLAGFLEKNGIGQWIVKGMNAIGDASFEIFLWHIGVFEFVKPRLEINALTWMLLLVVVVLWSIGYRKAVKRIFHLN